MNDKLIQVLNSIEALIKKQNEVIIKNQNDILVLHNRCNELEKEMKILKNYNYNTNLKSLKISSIEEDIREIKYSLNDKER